MRLRYISLHIDFDSGYKDMFRINFNQHARFISTYMSIQVRNLKFDTDGKFNMIGVTPSIQINHRCRIVGDKALQARLLIDKDRYDQLSEKEKYEYYLSLLEEGYKICSEYKDIPLEALLELHQSFRNNNYKNEWLHKKKHFKDQDIEVILYCYFTSVDFQLSITVNRLSTKEELISGIVIHTDPDEIYFQPLFKDITIDSKYLIITERHDRPKFKFRLSDINKSKFKYKVTNKGLDYIPLNTQPKTINFYIKKITSFFNRLSF